MDLLPNLWRDISGLRSLSNWLQWVSISLVFVSGFLQVGKYVVDRREKSLSAIAQAEQLSPYNKPIHTATATVELVVESAEQIHTHYMDRGGYLAFAKGQEALALMTSLDCFVRPAGKNELAWKGIFNLDAAHEAIGKPVNFLRTAEYIQIGFNPMKPKSRVKHGTAIVTINSAIRLTVDIPAQQMPGDFILVPITQSVLDQFK